MEETVSVRRGLPVEMVGGAVSRLFKGTLSRLDFSLALLDAFVVYGAFHGFLNVSKISIVLPYIL